MRTVDVARWLVCVGLLGASFAGAKCPGEIAVQVLGSGGPEGAGHRASSSYLVWIDGHSRVLVDAGGGAFVRFAEADASIDDLQLVALSHFHADHVADLAALVKAGYFSERKAALAVAGPSGNPRFPGLGRFLQIEFGAPSGAFAYLAGALDGSGGQFELKPIEVAISATKERVVLDASELHVAALPVVHGPVPALAYAVNVRGRRIVFSGDQDGRSAAFWQMASHADLLVMHHAVPEQADPVAARLHALPSVIGKQAQAAKVKHLLLSHLMARSLAALPESLAIITSSYKGPVSVAEDMQCVSVEAGF